MAFPQNASGEWRVANREEGQATLRLLTTRYSPLTTRFLFLQPLHDRHVRHAAAFAHGLEAVALAALMQRVDQRRHQLGAGAAEGMTERDGAAVDVETLRIG